LGRKLPNLCRYGASRDMKTLMIKDALKPDCIAQSLSRHNKRSILIAELGLNSVCRAATRAQAAEIIVVDRRVFSDRNEKLSR